jgi:uncharacterized protein YxjI
MDAQNTIYNRKQKKRTYLLTMEQAVSLKPQYHVYRDGRKPICTIEGDITRHRFSIRKDGTEVLRLSKKIAKLLTEYTIEKDGQVIAKIKKRISLLTHDFSGTINGQMVEIRADWYACRFDILIGGRKLCEIEQKKSGFLDTYLILMFDSDMDEIAAALAVICDRISDKDDSECEND